MGDALAVVVAGRSEHQVVTVFLIDTHLHDIGVEHHRHELFPRLALSSGDIVSRQLLLVIQQSQLVAQPLLGKLRFELGTAVVMVNAV